MPTEALPCVAFVGPSNSGKTTLITEVVRLLRVGGVHTATLKHAARHKLHAPNTDSSRHREAGAMPAMVAAADGLHIVVPLADQPVHQARAAAFSAGAQLLLIEGFRGASVDKILVQRRGATDPSWIVPAGIIATVSDQGGDMDLQQPGQVARFLRTRYDLSGPPG
jgi:molybdopterin-guanine dinucleotide biosynthesis protein B